MTTVDKIEIEKFSKLAKDWWYPSGKFKSLHLFNPARIEFIKEKLIFHLKLDPNSEKPLEKLKILDIGCGGGLLCEPLNRLGATITGIDASNDNTLPIDNILPYKSPYNIPLFAFDTDNKCFDINAFAVTSFSPISRFLSSSPTIDCF